MPFFGKLIIINIYIKARIGSLSPPFKDILPKNVLCPMHQRHDMLYYLSHKTSEPTGYSIRKWKMTINHLRGFSNLQFSEYSP